MSGRDDNLLARLNALKPSSVLLRAPSPSIDVKTSKPQSTEDKLADRLKNLRETNGASLSTHSERNNGSTAIAAPADVTEEVAASKDVIRDWQQGDGNDQTLDELIAELGESEADFALDPDESKHVEALLAQARAALPSEEEPALSQAAYAPQHADTHDTSHDSHKTEDQQDEEEADEYVRRLLAELEVEEEFGTENPQDSAPRDDQQPGTSSIFDLPSTPSRLANSVDPAVSKSPPSYEDSELEARFNQLGFALPSTPTNNPSSSKPKIQASLKPRSNLPTFTDEEVESWCCICNEDGEIRCVDCDDDIYCTPCWREGHGNKPGQERHHRALTFAKRKPQAQ